MAAALKAMSRFAQRCPQSLLGVIRRAPTDAFCKASWTPLNYRGVAKALEKAGRLSKVPRTQVARLNQIS
jgi:hypothetical protein